MKNCAPDLRIRTRRTNASGTVEVGVDVRGKHTVIATAVLAVILAVIMAVTFALLFPRINAERPAWGPAVAPESQGSAEHRTSGAK